MPKDMQYAEQRVDEVAAHYLRRFFGDGRWKRIYAAIKPGILSDIESAPDDAVFDAWELVAERLAIVCDEAVKRRDGDEGVDGRDAD